MVSTAVDAEPRSKGGSPPLLEVRDLAVRVEIPGEGWVNLVDDVTFSVGARETVGLVGESGSGKTITSLALMHLLPDAVRVSGSVQFEQQELTTMSRRQLDRMRGVDLSMIFQEPRRSLNPAFTVGDQVAETVRQHKGASRKEAWERAIDLFEMVGITDPVRRVRQYPHEFSGGMCQRVMLAMALALEPKLLIADEPTTALDVTVQRQVLGLIQEMQDRLGLGVLLITHDLGVVAEVCDRAIVMYAGRIVEDAPVMDIFDDPQHPYTAGLLQAMPDPVQHAKHMGVIDGVVPSPTEYAEHCRFLPRCPHATAACENGFLPLAAVGDGRRVRCARADELVLLEARHG